MKIVYDSQRMYEDITGEFKMQKEWKVNQTPCTHFKYDDMKADIELIFNCLILLISMRWETGDDKYLWGNNKGILA